MSRSFAKPAFSRTATSNTKQSTTSTQNTFTFQNYLSYFGRWLEKSNELRSNWRSAPPPTAPPSSLSSTCWLGPFSMDVEKGKDTSVLRRPSSGGCHRTGWMNPTKNWLQHWWWSLVPSCLLPHQGLLLPRSLLLTSSLCREFGGTCTLTILNKKSSSTSNKGFL